VPVGLCYYPAATGAAAALPLPGRGHQQTFERGATISRDLRVNEMIRIPQVRVIDDEGNQLGVMPTPQALEMAQERGLDLVEVAPMAAPPVARFLDFGQYKYELTKREKEAKRRQRSVTFKEVRLSPKIGSGDFLTKVHRAIEFLEDGDRIKVQVRFRGRELSHPELGRLLLERFAKQVEEHGVIERMPVLEGKSMFIVLASTHKPKGAETPPQRPARPDEPGSPAAEAPASAAATQPAPASEPAAASAPAPASEPVAASEPAAASKAAPAAAGKAAPVSKPAQTPAAASAPARTAEPTTEAAPAVSAPAPTAATKPANGAGAPTVAATKSGD
jgi:translation initiation factor IF-3